MKRVVLLLAIMFFSCAINATEQKLKCYSWWSGPDNIRHCLYSGNEETKTVLSQKKENNKTITQPIVDDSQIQPEKKADPIYIPTPEETPEIGPGFDPSETINEEN